MVALEILNRSFSSTIRPTVHINPSRKRSFISAVRPSVQTNPSRKRCFMYQSIPKPPIPPGKSPGIWLALSSVQWGIWPKMRPAWWGFDFPVKTSVSGRKQKDFAILCFSTWAAFTGHCSCRFHVGIFLLLSFYIVMSRTMPLFKAWSEDKLNKKFAVAENFAEHVSKGKRFCFPWRVGDLALFEALTGGAFDHLNWQHSGGIWPKFFKRQMPGGLPGGDGRFWNWPVHYLYG